MNEGIKVSWFRSIQTTISLIIVALSAIIIAGFIAVQFVTVHNRMEKELYNYADITATILSKYLVSPLWAVDKKEIEDMLDAEMFKQNIYGILIRDTDGNSILHGKIRDKNWNVNDTIENISGEYIVSEKEIVSQSKSAKGGSIGVVEVYITSRFMEEEFNALIMNSIITIVILSITIFAAIFISLKKVIIQPIMTLTEIANQVSLGKLDVTMNIKSKNEIGLLVDAFDRMQTGMRIAVDLLNKK